MTSSETPIYRYLWAADPAVSQISPGRLIQGRYEVVSPQIWRDTQPEHPPYIPEELPDEIIPYLRLFPQRLHVPEVYGWAVLGDEPDTALVPLLENVPIDADGDLYPSIVEAWTEASATRQVYWLWQILELWTALSEQGVASSLLFADNIRVQGWRVWLRELYSDGGAEQITSEQPTFATPTLKDLGSCWMQLSEAAAAPVAGQLQAIAMQMTNDQVEFDRIATQLNHLLLLQAAQLPLRIHVGGATDTGPQRATNEDACYPTASDLQDSASQPNDLLIPQFMLVCDGIGGHEGGEVASALALQTIKLQLRALLLEIAEQTEIVPPTLIADQLAAIVRIANNLISNQNDAQGRESRARMGTTLVMGLQLPQKIRFANGEELGNGHELYIVSVGDSRAYWITADYCQQLTIDDDVATREVRLGRSIYREALTRTDGGALTQALGTRDAQQLHPTIQRFIVEEDGLLLLCSDGLSDRFLVEQSWKDYAKPLLKGKLSLDAAVKSWINLANEQNGHDNTSVVLACYFVSEEPPALFNPKQVETTFQSANTRLQSELTAASRALLYDESVAIEKPEPTASPRRLSLVTLLGVLAFLVIVGVGGYALWLTYQQNNSPSQSVPEASQ